jgi:alanine racemase
MDAKHTEGEPRLLISRSALLHNAKLVRRAVGEQVRICAILKADAYGHGSAIVADTLCNFAADGSSRPAADAVAVATIDEAAALPADLGVPIIVFRPVENLFVGRQRATIDLAIRNDFVLSLCSVTAAEDLARLAVASGRRVAVQVIVETGMTRTGVDPGDLDDLLHKIAARPSLRLTGICTHFASADDPRDPLTGAQLTCFRAATDGFAEVMRGKVLRHAANSAAVFFRRDSHLEMVRPGLALYGIDPTCKPSLDRPLRPAMKWTAPLIGIRSVAKGTGVGYGHSWHAPRDTRIGVAPVGYADGYLRAFSDRAVVMIGGRPAPVVGRVSMDAITIDLANHPHVQLGDEVTLLDDDPLSPASVYRLAQLVDTIPYEIFCRIGPRVQRVVVGAERDAPETWETDPRETAR